MTHRDPTDEVERYSRDRLEEVQWKGLRALFLNISDLSPFYASKLAGIDGPSGKGTISLEGMPMTTREELVSAQVASPPWGGTLAVETTQCSIFGFSNAIAAGLTGRDSLMLAATADDMRSRVEVATRGLQMGGARAGDTSAIIGEVARSLLHHGFLSALAITGATPFQTGRGLTLRHVRHTLPALAPDQIVTHPTYAIFLARLLEEEGMSLPVERLFLWGEMGPSVPTMRATLEEAWQHAQVRDVYAMEELGVLAAECEAGDGLHGFEDHFVYEVVDPASGEVLGPGERGELVVTPLRSEAMPLLRYRTGDLVIVDDGRCSCGRSHLRLHVMGRVVDGPDGSHRILDLAKVEHMLASHRPLAGRYRIVLEGERAFLEVPFTALDDDQQAMAINTALLAAKSTGIDLRPVEELPAFHHRAVRVVDGEDLAWWEAVAEEQRRLEL